MIATSSAHRRSEFTPIDMAGNQANVRNIRNAHGMEQSTHNIHHESLGEESAIVG
jgi:hypothetical protein